MAGCRNCGSENVRVESHEWVETHGLDCGPYERCYEEGWKCGDCGAFEDSLDETETEEMAEVAE